MFLATFLNALPGACAQGIIWGIMAIGVFISFRILDIPDLTVDGSLATGGAIAVIAIRAGADPGIAVLGALLGGLAAGLATGLLHTRCGIPAILAGILTQLALYSVNLRIMGGKSNLPVSVDQYNLLVSQRYVHDLALANPLFATLILTALVVAVLYWLFGTQYGAALRATGSNERMARAVGINTKNAIVVSLMISNGLVAVSGALLAQYQGAVDVNMGRGAIVIGLAAVIIGEVLFVRRKTNFAIKMIGVVGGAIVYYLAIQVVLQMGLNTNDLKLITALLVAIFLSIPYWRSLASNKSRKEQPHAQDA